jgi:hypothetical protein
LRNKAVREILELQKMLRSCEAIEIYKMKLALQNQSSSCSASADMVSMWGKTGPVAKMFGVKPRTVKYIWNRQTWAHATKHLWDREADQGIPFKQVDIHM